MANLGRSVAIYFLLQARKEIDQQLNWTAKEAGTRAFLLTNLSLKNDNPGWEVNEAQVVMMLVLPF